MSFSAPTYAKFAARFPEFQGVASELIEAVLDEATPRVGDTWTDADRAPAILYLTAHLLAMEGEPGRSNGQGGAAAIALTGGVIREKVGDVEVQYAGTKSSDDASGYASTAYGRRYLEFLRRNFPAVAIV